MKAIVYERYGPPEVLELQELATPTPKNNEVLIRTHATTVTAGDCRVRSLRMPVGFGLIARLVLGVSKPRQPILGSELAGTVESVGKDVRTFKVGDEVFAFTGARLGCHAEYKCMPEAGAVALKPASLTFDEAAAMSSGGTTALDFFRRAKLQSGEKVAVNGASGGVGTAAVQLAKHFGADVTGVCSTRNVDLVRSLGADHVIDYTKEDFAKGTERYDVILDNVPNHSLSECRRILTPNGKYVMIGGGGPNDSRWVGPFGRVIKTMVLSPFTSQKMGMMMADANGKDLTILADMMQSGKLKPVIDRTYKLNEVPAAIAYLEEGHARGKVVITVE